MADVEEDDEVEEVGAAEARARTLDVEGREGWDIAGLAVSWSRATLYG